MGSRQISKLTTYFPFCPEAMFQQSIFLADFKRDFMKASIASSKGFALVNNGTKSITAYFNSQFRPFFSGKGCEINIQKPVLDQYTFLSVAEHSADFAVRHPNHPIQDEYLKANSNAYTAQRNHLFHEAPFLNRPIKQFNSIVVFMGVIMPIFVKPCVLMK